MANSKYGLNVNGKIRVFRKDKDLKKGKKTFTITDVWFNVSEKDENGEWFNKSMNLLFKKGLDLPENNSTIVIIDSFLVITGDGDYRRIAIMVTDWKEVEEEKK